MLHEWTKSPPGPDGVELLQASFNRHVYDRHMHDTYAIGVTLRGVQRFWCRGGTHDSTPGHVLVIRPGEVHDGRSGSAGGYEYRMLYVRPEIVHDIADDAHGRRADLDVAGPLVCDRIAFDLLNAGWNALARSPSSLASDELLLRGVSALALGRRTPIDMPAREHDRALNQVCDYLHANIERAVTMHELAAIASMSRFQLTRRFQQRYGLPVHGYFRHLRLEEAKRRLARGDEIASVAAYLGFVDQSHFHRRFRGSYGMTPGQWRRAYPRPTPGLPPGLTPGLPQACPRPAQALAPGLRSLHVDTRRRGRPRATVSSAMGVQVDLKRFDLHGDVRRFPRGQFEVVQIGGLSIGRATYEPGWRWSEHVGPGVGTTRCLVEHIGLVVSGAAAVAFDDGDVVTMRAGDLFHVPPIPHDSWVVGDEPYVSLHLLGAGHYATADAPRPREGDARCFVCGWDNPKSLGVSFERDPNGGSRTHYVARPEHDGWPGLLHGGVLFSLLDDAAGWAARFTGRSCVTSRASIRFRQPVPTGSALSIGADIRPRGRVLSAHATASRVDDGSIVAELEALLFPRRP